MTRVLILSTQPKSNKGGISSSVNTLLKCLEIRNTNYSFILTHDPDSGRFKNTTIFLFATINLFIKIFLEKISRNPISVYLHAGPKGSLVRKYIIAEICYLFRVKVFTQHHSPIFDDYLKQTGILSRLLIRTSKISYKNLVLSDWWMARYRQRGIFNVEIVPNGVEAPSSLKSTKNQNLQPVILSIGRLTTGKNFDILINSMDHLRNFSVLKIAGGGRELENLKLTASNLANPQAVEFLGWINNQQKESLYLESDLFALPSNYDSFGIVFIEALAHGCPVVIGPNPAVISALSGLPGVFIANSFTVSDFAAAIDQALASKIDRRHISKQCISKYGLSTIATTITAVLELTDDSN